MSGPYLALSENLELMEWQDFLLFSELIACLLEAIVSEQTSHILPKFSIIMFRHILFQVSVANASSATNPNSTTSTGTSTGPLPATTETGTQSSETRNQQATGTQHDGGGISEYDMQRIQEQMSAVLGQVWLSLVMHLEVF